MAAVLAKGKTILTNAASEPHVQDLCRMLVQMGARIVLCDPHRAVISGPAKLHGSELTSPDVRAGMAMLIAALCAEGKSVIRNVYQIERGYEHLADRLASLGARIARRD